MCVQPELPTEARPTAPTSRAYVCRRLTPVKTSTLAWARTNEDDAQAIADGVLWGRGVIDADVAGRRGAASQVIPDLAEAGQVGAEAKAPNCADKTCDASDDCSL